MRAVMEDGEYQKYSTAVMNGISPQRYVQYLKATKGLKADKDSAGKTVSGSLKKKVLTAIDDLLLTPAQKDVLYDLAGYSRNTIQEAPWRGGQRYVTQGLPALGGNNTGGGLPPLGQSTGGLPPLGQKATGLPPLG